jgi:hypothetical protein
VQEDLDVEEQAPTCHACDVAIALLRDGEGDVDAQVHEREKRLQAA